MLPVTPVWERRYWLLAVLFYGVGDTVTTLIGLSLGGVAEAGPIADPAMEAFGAAGLLAIKIVIFAGFGFIWSLLEPPTRVAVPLALAIVGGVVSGWNTVVIVSAL